MASSGDSRPYFGSIPDFGTEQEGYPISGASPGSPAERGGLKGGDVIVELGGQKIGGLEDFDSALRKFSAGDEVIVIVLRKGERVELKVVLDKPR
jgi:S1-C subfamily serine protease